MKRFIFKLVLLLLLGAIINVVVAYVLLLGQMPKVRTWVGINDDLYPEVLHGLYEGPDGQLVHQFEFVLPSAEQWRYQELAYGVDYVQHLLPMNRRIAQTADAAVETAIATGWPSRSLATAMRPHGQHGLGLAHAGSTFLGEIHVPVFRGFVINTTFYAAILWLLFAFPFTLRRWRRIKRGLCPKCGYDLRGSDHKLCPECGEGALKRS